MAKSFKDYKENDWKYITSMGAELYPDYLDNAKQLYYEAQKRFRELTLSANSSADLLRAIMNEPPKIRTKILSIFCRYVSPTTKTELLKKKSKLEKTIKAFEAGFRPIDQVKSAVINRPLPDETLSALLYQYKDRGRAGYDLTEMFFSWFEEKFGNSFTIEGPVREGSDIILSKVLPGFPHNYPADFLIRDKKTKIPLVVGFARYDSDRGGSQEDDRTGGNRDKVPTILRYSIEKGIPLKILFVNDGPGLLLGSMWSDYADIEESGNGKVMVSTLKMLDERLTEEWIRG